MLIIIDKKIPDEAKSRLKQYGDLVELGTSNITYDAISGHPDIFFCKVNDQLIIAPNLPVKYTEFLKSKGINFIMGEERVGEEYPQSSKYNIVCNSKYLIHNFRNTDSIITRLGEDYDLIHVDQGYTRCNLVPLKGDCFISSDKGISKVLNRSGLNNYYVNPESIVLPGFKNGFFGGCCGIMDNKLFVIGSLDHLAESTELKEYLNSQSIEVIELYDGPLFDGGSILFL